MLRLSNPNSWVACSIAFNIHGLGRLTPLTTYTRPPDISTGNLCRSYQPPSDRLHGITTVLLLSDNLALWGELSRDQIRELNPTLPGPFGAVSSVAGCSPQAYRIFRSAEGRQLF